MAENNEIIELYNMEHAAAKTDYAKQKAEKHKKDATASLVAYREGGYVKDTGLVWADGTKQNPEAFLDAVDTKLIREWVDSLKKINTNIPRLNMTGLQYSGNTNTIGDIHVTITEAEFKEDADYDKVAIRVGESFARELSKVGFNISNYSL